MKHVEFRASIRGETPWMLVNKVRMHVGIGYAGSFGRGPVLWTLGETEKEARESARRLFNKDGKKIFDALIASGQVQYPELQLGDTYVLWENKNEVLTHGKTDGLHGSEELPGPHGNAKAIDL